MIRWFLAGAAFGLLLVLAYAALALWVDERNQRFYMANEPRNWAG
jgi:hypothetical protein